MLLGAVTASATKAMVVVHVVDTATSPNDVLRAPLTVSKSFVVTLTSNATNLCVLLLK